MALFAVKTSVSARVYSYNKPVKLTSASKSCICCLAENETMLHLANCKHNGFLQEFIQNFQNIVVCKICHLMLKKIYIFKRQVFECSKKHMQSKDLQNPKKLYNLQTVQVIYDTSHTRPKIKVNDKADEEVEDIDNEKEHIENKKEDFNVSKQELTNYVNLKRDVATQTEVKANIKQMQTDIEIETIYENDNKINSSVENDITALLEYQKKHAIEYNKNPTKYDMNRTEYDMNHKEFDMNHTEYEEEINNSHEISNSFNLDSVPNVDSDSINSDMDVNYETDIDIDINMTEETDPLKHAVIYENKEQSPVKISTDVLPLNNSYLIQLLHKKNELPVPKSPWLDTYKNVVVEEKHRDKARIVILNIEEVVKERENESKKWSKIKAQFKCDTCFKLFVDDEALERHKREFHVHNGPFKCEICQVKIDVKCYFRHLMVHVLRFQCVECGVRSSLLKNIIEHYKRHENERINNLLKDQTEPATAPFEAKTSTIDLRNTSNNPQIRLTNDPLKGKTPHEAETSSSDPYIIELITSPHEAKSTSTNPQIKLTNYPLDATHTKSKPLIKLTNDPLKAKTPYEAKTSSSNHYIIDLINSPNKANNTSTKPQIKLITSPHESKNLSTKPLIKLKKYPLDATNTKSKPQIKLTNDPLEARHPFEAKTSSIYPYIIDLINSPHEANNTITNPQIKLITSPHESKHTSTKPLIKLKKYPLDATNTKSKPQSSLTNDPLKDKTCHLQVKLTNYLLETKGASTEPQTALTNTPLDVKNTLNNPLALINNQVEAKNKMPLIKLKNTPLEVTTKSKPQTVLTNIPLKTKNTSNEQLNRHHLFKTKNTITKPQTALKDIPLEATTTISKPEMELTDTSFYAEPTKPQITLTNDTFEAENSNSKQLKYQVKTMEDLSESINTKSKKDSTVSDKNWVYKCARCHFHTDSYLESYIHIEKHKILSCPICDKSINTSPNLDEHLKTIHKMAEKDIGHCHFCDERFGEHVLLVSEEHLEKHRHHVTHENEGFICKECNARFYNDSYLQAHMVWKHPAPAFTCFACSKEFKNYARLRSHIRLIHEMKGKCLNLICEHCGKHFTVTKRLKYHINTRHKDKEGGKIYKCSHCDSSYKHPKALYMHVLKKHENVTNK